MNTQFDNYLYNHETFAASLNPSHKVDWVETVQKYILELSANGEGSLIINKGYINADGFICNDTAAIRNSDADTVIDNITYYAFNMGDTNAYFKQNFEDKSSGDVIENIGFYMIEYGAIIYNSEESENLLTLTITKYDPTYTGPLQEIIHYLAGDNLKIECALNILSVAQYDSVGTLTAISIPNSVTSIGESAFANCSRLDSIIYNGTISLWNAISKGTSWHSGVPATTVVTCTDGTVALD